ncbi:MAG: hypothetical protein Ct9H300mP15_30210 [Gemmatimonadota bacterium]|nr:MAG: hypothetical protein Ct9H300mP15_30210 [Gemmatimonadota bacterium]
MPLARRFPKREASRIATVLNIGFVNVRDLNVAMEKSTLILSGKQV